MVAVGVALIGGARVDVHVGNHAQAALLAHILKLPEVAAVEPYDAGIQRMRVEIVVENEVDDPGVAISAISEQERSALPAAGTAAFTQSGDKPVPQKPGTGKLMPRRQQAATNLRDQARVQFQILIYARSWPPDSTASLTPVVMAGYASLSHGRYNAVPSFQRGEHRSDPPARLRPAVKGQD
jgi:hypothetical protein